MRVREPPRAGIAPATRQPLTSRRTQSLARREPSGLTEACSRTSPTSRSSSRTAAARSPTSAVVSRRLPAGHHLPEILRNLYYDICLYTQDSIELLIRAVGTDRCLFGTEKPGTGSVKDPATGRWVDDIHLLIEDIEWIDDAERDQVFAGNAQQLFKL